MSPLPPRAEVVVVGGGIIGTSIAFHLAEAGVDVCLLEREQLASGSTSRAAGGVRAQFSDPLNIQLGLRSLEAFAHFGERPGAEIDLAQVGYLFLLDRPEDVDTFERNVALQNELGLPSRLVTVEEAATLSPLAGLEGVLAATYCPLDGTASPEAAVQGYAAGAREHGAQIVTDCSVTGIDHESGEIYEVHTELGSIRTGVVVCAAGVWSPRIAELIGFELPVEPVFREVGYTGPAELPGRFPLTVDFSTSLYFHREGPGLLFGLSDREQRPGFDAPPPEREWLEKVVEVAERRLPGLLEMGVAGGWRGYYDMSPDANALVGEAPGPSRFLYATGFSGHGFLQGPAIGEVVRDLVLEREPFVDVAPLGVARFERAAPRPEHNVI
jgi:sarcosine oxidase subunit beta